MNIILNNENLKLIEKVITRSIKIKSENIIGYNEEEDVYISLNGNKVIEAGEVNLDKTVLKYVNDEEEAIIRSEDDEILINQNKRKIITEDITICNDLKDINMKGKKLFTITKESLQQIYEIKYAVAQDETRPILQTIHIDEKNIVALDGYRLAIRKHNIKNMKKNINIPYSIFKICKKLKIDDNLDVYECSGNIILTNGVATLKIKKVDGEYIKYKCLLK
ncbi:hypothetical protein ACSW9O_15475 (plasmid) [Clostridium perfringens]|nr:hypothetical protein [Clostridium perfringens]